MQSPWLLHLDQIGARFAEGASGTVSFSDNARDEVALAANGTVIVPLTHLGTLRAAGEDACAFLHNLMSNDIKKLELHSAHWNSFNSPKGRMLASFLVWRDSSDYLLQLSADLLASMHKKLGMYVLRSKVRITDTTPDLAAIGIAGPAVARVLDAAGLTLPPEAMSVSQGAIQIVRLDGARVQVIAPLAQAADLWKKFAAAGASPAGTAAWQWLDVRAGLPVITLATQDEFVAQMINFEVIGGVNFQKGCYPGQEIVARTQYLGKLKKRMFLAHVDALTAPFAGQDLFAPDFADQSCGKVVAATPAPTSGFDLLAVVQMSSHDANQVTLGAPAGPALHFQPLPYALP
ncbi:folate-binding protein [Niveibacterium sp. 24ML]|uniref:CAF17-like 4Fe-4S cluster assembly/insertion protein YgfZ n=1 Tax=Niveibacterium sp. 24ML TaxID=2985512 RepID=UPI00226DE360|nr:folate-binding protein [Niveibacterium sp. 24ML]MCX9156730.1 folate-binding protein [Niveibacterium sp. 24ML]